MIETAGQYFDRLEDSYDELQELKDQIAQSESASGNRKLVTDNWLEDIKGLGTFTSDDVQLEIVWLDPWNLPNTKIIEGAILPSGRIVVMSDQDSYWFDSDGTSPKGTFLLRKE